MANTVTRARSSGKGRKILFILYIPKRLILGSIRVRGSHEEGQHNLLKRARTSKGVAQKILVVVTIAIWAAHSLSAAWVGTQFWCKHNTTTSTTPLWCRTISVGDRNCWNDIWKVISFHNSNSLRHRDITLFPHVLFCSFSVSFPFVRIIWEELNKIPNLLFL